MIGEEEGDFLPGCVSRRRYFRRINLTLGGPPRSSARLLPLFFLLSLLSRPRPPSPHPTRASGLLINGSGSQVSEPITCMSDRRRRPGAPGSIFGGGRRHLLSQNESAKLTPPPHAGRGREESQWILRGGLAEALFGARIDFQLGIKETRKSFLGWRVRRCQQIAAH